MMLLYVCDWCGVEERIPVTMAAGQSPLSYTARFVADGPRDSSAMAPDGWVLAGVAVAQPARPPEGPLVPGLEGDLCPACTERAREIVDRHQLELRRELARKGKE